VIELAILGVLREQELHGYELKKRIAEVAGSRASFGSLYPGLARLEASGAVKAVEAATRARSVPLTGSLSGEASVFRTRRLAERGTRGRKSYGITERGERLLEELLEDPSLDDKAFRLKVAFCRYLDPARRLALFRRRRSTLEEQLHAASAGRRRVGSERLDAYRRLLREHDREQIEREIAWIDRLIAAETDRSDETDPPDPTQQIEPAEPAPPHGTGRPTGDVPPEGAMHA